MSTDISPQNEQYIQQEVARGAFPSRGKALDEAVELLKQRDQWTGEVQAGIDQIERGEYEPMEMEKVKAGIRERLAQEGKSF